MNNKIVLTENIIIKNVLKLLKEDEIEKVYISPDEYIQYLRQVGFMAHAIPHLPKFKGKKLVVDGNLQLSNLDNRKKINKGC
jgi:UDP:flavonoid glycosyltransferase YjiC (YdhE family)